MLSEIATSNSDVALVLTTMGNVFKCIQYVVKGMQIESA